MKEQINTPSSKERWITARFIRPNGSIEVYENYIVSDHGRVASLVDNHGNKRSAMKIMKPQLCSIIGHLQVGMYINGEQRMRTIHRIVLSSFKSEDWSKDTNEVDHKDRNPTNNFLNNLHWTSHSGNMDNRCNTKRIMVTYLSESGRTELFNNMRAVSRAFGKAERWCANIISSYNGYHKRLNILIEKIDSTEQPEQSE